MMFVNVECSFKRSAEADEEFDCSCKTTLAVSSSLKSLTASSLKDDRFAD